LQFAAEIPAKAYNLTSIFNWLSEFRAHVSFAHHVWGMRSIPCALLDIHYYLFIFIRHNR